MSERVFKRVDSGLGGLRIDLLHWLMPPSLAYVDDE